MIRKQILTDLKKILEKLEFTAVDPFLEYPVREIHGDYATNVALVLWEKQKRDKKKVKKFKTPLDLAKEIVSRYKLRSKLYKPKAQYKAETRSYLDKIEIAPPGFINFFLSSKHLVTQIAGILKQEKNYGSLKAGQEKKVQVEFISANPTGPLTLGNGRGGFMGDTLANVLEKVGYDVEREYYINNTGEQVRLLGESVQAILGQISAKPEHYKGKYIEEWAQKNKSQLMDDNADQVGSKLAEFLLENEIKPVVEKKMKIYFDRWFSELSLYHSSAQVEVEKELSQKGYLYQKDNALWFKSSLFGDDKDRVLLTSEETKGRQNYTYFFTDIAYHQDKHQRGFEKVIDIWGADHHGYQPRMKAAMKALGYPDDWLQIIIVQLVRLKEGEKEIKMSKRGGTYITLEELIDEVGLDVARFFFLSHEANSHMDFDLKLAKERSEENPVFYVQYAHARICSIFKKAPQIDFQKAKFSLLDDPSEIKLLKHLLQFPELVEEISRSYAVNQLPSYAIKLADLFHKFYEDCRVISQDKELTAARLALVRATQIVLVDTLDLLGVSTPEKM